MRLSQIGDNNFNAPAFRRKVGPNGDALGSENDGNIEQDMARDQIAGAQARAYVCISSNLSGLRLRRESKRRWARRRININQPILETVFVF